MANLALAIQLTAQDQASGPLRSATSAVTGLEQAAGRSGPSFLSMASAVAVGTAAVNALMGVAHLVVGGLEAGIRSTSDFGQSMANLGSVLPEADMQQFGGQLQGLALQLGKDYPLSAGEAAQAMTLLGQRGLSAEDILGGAAKAVVLLSSATGTDLVTAAGLAAASVNTFGLSGADTVHVVDLMTGAIIKSGTTAEQFGFAMQMVGAVAKTIGFDIDSTSIAIATMAKAGLQGSDAGTSLKTMFLNLSPQTTKAAEEMRSLGIITKDGSNQFFDAEGHVKSYEEVSRILATSVSKLNDEQKIQALTTLFGTDAVRAAAITARAGAGDFGDLGAAIHGVDAEGVANKRMDSLHGSMQQLGGSVETLAIVLGGTLAPGLKVVIDKATEFTNALIDVASAADFSPVATAFEAMKTSAVNNLSAAGDAVASFGDDVLAKIPGVGPIFDSAANVAGSALKGMSALMRGDVKGAMDAFGEAWRQLSTGTLPMLGGAVNTAVTDLGRLKDALAPAVVGAANDAANSMQRFGEVAAQVDQQISNHGGAAAMAAGMDNLGRTVGIVTGGLGELGHQLDTVGTAGDAAGKNLSPLSLIALSAAQAFEHTTAEIRIFADGLVTLVKVGGDTVEGLAHVAFALEDLKSAKFPEARAELGLATAAFTAAGAEVSAFWQRATTDSAAGGVSVGASVTTMRDNWAQGMTQMDTATTQTWADIDTATGSGTSLVDQAVQSGGAAAAQSWESGLAPMAPATDQAMTGIETAIDGGGAIAASAAGTQATSASEQFGTNIAGMATTTTTAMSGVNTAVVSGGGTASGSASAAGSSIGDSLAAGLAAKVAIISARARALAQAAIDGLNIALRGGSPSVSGSAAAVVDDAAQAAENAAEVHSPSLRFQRIGVDIVTGLEAGLHSGLAPIEAEGAAMPAAVADGIESGTPNMAIVWSATLADMRKNNSGTWNDIAGYVKTSSGLIIRTIQEGGNNIRTSFQGTANDADHIFPTIVPPAAAAASAVQSRFQEAMKNSGGALDLFENTANADFRQLVADANVYAPQVVPPIAAATTNSAEHFEALGEIAGDSLNSIRVQTIALGKDLPVAINDGIAPSANAFQVLGAIAGDSLNSIAKEAKAKGKDIVGSMGSAADDSSSAFEDFAGNSGDSFHDVSGAGKKTGKDLDSAFSDAADKMDNNVNDALDNIGKGLKNLDKDIDTTAKKLGGVATTGGKISHASGGYAPPGELSLVGEQGPELFVSPGGYILPAGPTAQYLGGGGGIGGGTYIDRRVTVNALDVSIDQYQLERMLRRLELSGV